jgi:hypothetical protein
MRKALRTPSFSNGSPGIGAGRRTGSGLGFPAPSSSPSASDSKAEGQLGGDWSHFDVDVFLGVVDYARDRLRDVKALVACIRDTQKVARDLHVAVRLACLTVVFVCPVT